MKNKCLTILSAIVLLLSIGLVAVSAGTQKKMTQTKSSGTLKETKTVRPCSDSPKTQVVNNSGMKIFRIRVGTVEFYKNLSRCSDGCSTGFKQVRADRNEVSVKFEKTSSWKKIGTLGKFSNCGYYAVNIIKKGNTLCAVLALRQQTDTTYNNDRTKKIIARTCGKLEKTDTLPAIKNRKTLTHGQRNKKVEPRMVRQNKRAILKFPEAVKNLVIRDDKGKLIQKFDKGMQFDITKSIKDGKGKELKLTYMLADSPHVKPGKRPGNLVPFEGEITFLLSTVVMHRSIFETLRDLDRGEPANNDINGALNTISGNLTGTVGGDDPADYFYIRTSPSGYGTYFRISRVRGDINLHLYDPGKRYLDWDRDSVWIAVEPNTTFYVQVEPASASSAEYEVDVEIKPLFDAMEPNDSFAAAKAHTTAGNKILCNLFSRTGAYVGIKDYYKFNLTQEKLIRVNIANAGLESGRSISISLYDKDNVHHTTETGSAGSATLEYDLRGDYDSSWPQFPAGEWRILVTTHSESNARPYGTGTGPGCYTNAAGYSLDLDLID